MTPRRPVVLTQLVVDVLDAAKNRKHLPPRGPILRTELAGEALAVAGAPVDEVAQGDRDRSEFRGLLQDRGCIILGGYGRGATRFGETDLWSFGLR